MRLTPDEARDYYAAQLTLYRLRGEIAIARVEFEMELPQLRTEALRMQVELMALPRMPGPRWVEA